MERVKRGCVQKERQTDVFEVVPVQVPDEEVDDRDLDQIENVSPLQFRGLRCRVLAEGVLIFWLFPLRGSPFRVRSSPRMPHIRSGPYEIRNDHADRDLDQIRMSTDCMWSITIIITFSINTFVACRRSVNCIGQRLVCKRLYFTCYIYKSAKGGTLWNPNILSSWNAAISDVCCSR